MKKMIPVPFYLEVFCPENGVAVAEGLRKGFTSVSSEPLTFRVLWGYDEAAVRVRVQQDERFSIRSGPAHRSPSFDAHFRSLRQRCAQAHEAHRRFALFCPRTRTFCTQRRRFCNKTTAFCARRRDCMGVGGRHGEKSLF